MISSKIWGHSPWLLYGLQAFYRALDRPNSPLEPALRTLINCKVSQLNHCAFCVDISTALLEKQKVSVEKIQALGDFTTSSLFTEREKACLAYAVAMTVNQPTEKLIQELRKNFADTEIVELTALIAYQNLSSKFNAALGVPAQGFCVTPLIQEIK